MKLREVAPKWDRDLWINRFEQCLIALKIHGFISDTEGRKVRARLYKRWVRETPKEAGNS